MKNFFEDIRTNRVIHYIIIITASLIAAIPLINLKIYGTDDGFVHVFRIFGTDQIIKSGIFPPYIYSNFANGFGYAVNLFYGPLVTYGPLLVHIICKSYTKCIKIFTYLTIVISGFTMYNFMYELSKKREIAVLGAIIYMFIPYRLETIYNRFAIGEFSAYMFFPILFQGLYNLLQGDGKKHYYIAISAIGLMLTHTISTEYAAILAFLYLLFNIKCLKNKEKIKKIAINIVFILLIAAFFTIPLFEHKITAEYVIFDSTYMRSLPSDVQNSALSVKQFFVETEEPNGVNFNLELPLIICTVLGIFVYKRIDKKLKDEYISFSLIALISLVMATKYFPWLIMPKILTTLQFAWRMLAFAEFALSIICAINVYYTIQTIAKNKEKLQNILFCFSIIIIIASMSKVNYNYRYEDKVFENEEYERLKETNAVFSVWAINREYLPSKIRTTELWNSYLDFRKNTTYVLEGNATITNEIKNNLELEFDIEDAEKDTILELPYIYYLGYEVEITENGNSTKIETFESENGFVAIKIDKDIEKASISVKYKGTIIEKISYVISATSTVLFIIYIIYSKRKNKIDEKSIK